MHSGAGSYIYDTATQRRIPVRLRYDSLFIVHDHGGGSLSGRSYFQQDRHLTRRGAFLRAMRINRHCKKNHSQGRQELVKSPGCMRCISRTLLVAEMALDTTVLGAFEIGRYVERDTIMELSARSSNVKNAQIRNSR